MHFIPLHLHSYYVSEYGHRARGLSRSPRAEFMRSVSLPIYSAMTDADVDRVIKAVEAVTSGPVLLEQSA